MKIELVNALNIFWDNNNGYEYGINYIDENDNIIDCEWFKTPMERQKSIIDSMDKDTYQNIKNEQLELFYEIQSHNLNLVTCGSCGGIFIHRLAQEELLCPHCLNTSEPCDNGDLYFSNWYSKLDDKYGTE